MADPGKPLTAQAREDASRELGVLWRTAGAARELLQSGVPVTPASALEDITEMEKILDVVRRMVTREL